MTERIDHALIAQNNLDWVGGQTLTPDQAIVTVTAAQVHATLAVAEQQRIANLIAYVARWTDDEVLDVDAEIRKALRIDD